jgi:hypothetical protein
LYTHYLNVKIVPVEIIAGIGGGEKKGEWLRGEFRYDTLIYYNKFCKCTPTQYNNTNIYSIKLVFTTTSRKYITCSHNFVDYF